MGLWKTPTAEPLLSHQDFHEKVTHELHRLSKKRVGALAIEAKTIVNHLRQNDHKPSTRDLIELLVVTHILCKKYNFPKLAPWSDARTHADAVALYEENLKNVTQGRKDWSCSVYDIAFALHKRDLEENTLPWLIEWEPEEYRIHHAKVAVLKETRFTTLTKILVIMAEREQLLLDGKGNIGTSPHQQSTLWQSISETRAMRNETSDAWCAHRLCPTDFAEAIRDAAPAMQLAFIKEHKPTLMEILAEEKVQEAQAAKGNTPDTPEQAKTFSLYD